MVERFNQTLIKMIKSYIDGKQNNWDINLGCLAGAYRSSIHESTGYTPNMLMLGREVRVPLDLIHAPPNETGKQPQYGEYVSSLKNQLIQAHDEARKWLKKSVTCQEETYNTRIAANSYRAGDLVWFLNETRVPGQCPKLQNMWSGPCMVKEKFSDLTYLIVLNSKGTTRVVHHDKLKPYQGNHIPKWIQKLSSN
jgi:hypothetical protein